jgi:hypothetical protein
MKKEDDLKYFNAIGDLLLNAIRKSDFTVTKTISDFLYKEFKNERDSQDGQPVLYPVAFYELVYRIIEELAILKERKNYALEYRASGSVWFLGEISGSIISDTTYRWMWRNIILALRYDQDRMIKYHWEKAHQFYSFSLSYIHAELESDSSGESRILVTKNQVEIDERKNNRKKFLEFHHALGGLLLYSENYKLIKQIFTYSTSYPPNYPLLPKSMDEIFKGFNRFYDPHETNFEWISDTYYFPDLSGMNAEKTIKDWICKYFVVLFLRQYSIVPHLITIKPLEYPSLPTNQSKIKQWIDSLIYFKNIAIEILGEVELLKTLELDYITEEWCTLNNKLSPLNFIKELNQNLEKSYEHNSVFLPIDKSKVTQFYDSTVTIIESQIDRFKAVTSNKLIEKEYNNRLIGGQNQIQDRDAFVKEPEIHHLDFDSFLAKTFARRIGHEIISTFFLNRDIKYLLNSSDIFNAINKLNVNDEYLIINIGIDLKRYITESFLPSEESYENIKIVNIDVASSMPPSIFVVKKDLLPNILVKDVDREQIEKYQLESIGKKHKLYASVVDLNLESSINITKDLKESNSASELKKSLLLSIITLIEIRWKKSTDMVQLIEYSEYRQQGLANKLEDVKKMN